MSRPTLPPAPPPRPAGPSTPPPPPGPKAPAMTNPTPPPNPADPVNPGGPNTPYRLSQDRRVAAYAAQNRHRELLTHRQVRRVIKKQRRLERVAV